MERKYGWIKQNTDGRDYNFSATRPVLGLPASVDLRPKMPAVYDQGQTSSCTAHATAAALEYAMGLACKLAFTPSRLFIYYNERLLEGTTGLDGGAMIRDGLKSCNQYGYAPETMWPFDPGKVLITPPETIYKAGALSPIHYYATVSLTNISKVKLCLSHSFPIIFGFEVFDYFESADMASKAYLPLPNRKEKHQGGHAVLIVGYDDIKKAVLVRNSWGPDWGIGGYFWMDYNYVTSELCSDAWMVRLK